MLSISDIVFFIFLYQRWIYKVDEKRVNEFGFSQEMLDKKKNESEAAAAGTKAIKQKSNADKKDD